MCQCIPLRPLSFNHGVPDSVPRYNRVMLARVRMAVQDCCVDCASNKPISRPRVQNDTKGEALAHLSTPLIPWTDAGIPLPTTYTSDNPERSG